MVRILLSHSAVFWKIWPKKGWTYVPWILWTIFLGGFMPLVIWLFSYQYVMNLKEGNSFLHRSSQQGEWKWTEFFLVLRGHDFKQWLSSIFFTVSVHFSSFFLCSFILQKKCLNLPTRLTHMHSHKPVWVLESGEDLCKKLSLLDGMKLRVSSIQNHEYEQDTDLISLNV